jgi:LysM repeat protein
VKHSKLQFPTMSYPKRFSYWIILLLIFSLVLVACERTIPDPVETEDVQPTAYPVLEDPFTAPDPGPTDPTDGYPPPEETTDPPPGEVDDPPAEEEPEPEPEEPEPEIVEPGGTYTVQAGDTLFRIAQRYGITVEALARANNITNVNRLDIGTILTIPGPDDVPPAPEPGEEQIHVVQAGETLFRIALRYGFTVEELASYNDIADPTRIDIGQQIRIPAR